MHCAAAFVHVCGLDLTLFVSLGLLPLTFFTPQPQNKISLLTGMCSCISSLWLVILDIFWNGP